MSALFGGVGGRLDRLGRMDRRQHCGRYGSGSDSGSPLGCSQPHPEFVVTIQVARLSSERGIWASLFFCFWLVITCFQGFVHFQDHVAEKYWPRATAQVAQDGKRVRRRGNTSYNFSATYVVNGQTFARTFAFKDQPSEFVTIAYNPRDPSDSISIERFDWTPGWFLVFLSGTAVFGWVLVRVLQGKI